MSYCKYLEGQHHLALLSNLVIDMLLQFNVYVTRQLKVCRSFLLKGSIIQTHILVNTFKGEGICNCVQHMPEAINSICRIKHERVHQVLRCLKINLASAVEKFERGVGHKGIAS